MTIDPSFRKHATTYELLKPGDELILRDHMNRLIIISCRHPNPGEHLAAMILAGLSGAAVAIALEVLFTVLKGVLS